MCQAEPHAADMHTKRLQQIIIALSGSFDVIFDDGVTKGSLLPKQATLWLVHSTRSLAGTRKFLLKLRCVIARFSSLRRIRLHQRLRGFQEERLNNGGK